MKYLHIELVGFKRFALNNIDRFSMDITEAVQLILGTNGSGKSSLMEQITPLPANHADFTKQGSKLIKISHNRHIYTLKSVFYPSQKHSFLRDDEELNEGGTVTVQRELVKKHFGITPEIHELALGNETFTNMSPARRKEWFIQLCDTNYDYAIKVYNKLREKHRDCIGAIKLAKKRLVSESEKLIQDDTERLLHQEATQLYECVQFLAEYRKPIESDLDNLEVIQSQLDHALFSTAKSLSNVHAGIVNLSGNEYELNTILLEADHGISRTRAIIEKYTYDYQKNQKKIEALQKAEQQTIEEVKSTMVALKREREEFCRNSILSEAVGKPKTALEALNAVKLSLTEIFSNIPKNDDRRYSQEAYAATKEKHASLLVTKAAALEKLQSKTARLKHLQDHKDQPGLECPKCSHQFSPHYNEAEHIRLEKEIELLQKELETFLTPAIASHEETLESFAEYSRLYRQYVQCVSAWPILQQYWQWMSEQKIITDDPRKGIYCLSKIEADLLYHIRIDEIDVMLKEKELLVLSLKDLGGADLKSLTEQNNELDVLIAEETDKLRKHSLVKTQAQSDLKRLAQIKQLSEKVHEIIQKKRACNKEQIETIRRTELNGAIRKLHSELASREHILSGLKQQKAIVENITTQIADLEKEEQALSLLVKQLSPTEGLIAEGLFGFIRNFVHQMNTFIQKVWTYPLTIQSSTIQEDSGLDMDYKFPLLVQSAENRASDVSRGSVGMKEIVNLAYRLTAMRYLGLQEYPLILDEWGGAMDEAHRGQASMVIKSLVEQHVCSQLFMVSHYFAQYGALSNAEVCVLNNLNITVPVKYNTHVKMS